jgi:predicted ArsR family transcriptional regulator
VENTPGLVRRPGYGPAPGGGRSARTHSPARAEILSLLRAQPEPVTLARLVSLSGLHPNTIREHLDGLLEQGLARRGQAAPSGRGRPAWLFEATAGDPGAVTEYAGLATALASAISTTSASPREDAVSAGVAWGRELARNRGAVPQSTATAARREVVSLLDDLGFAPRADQRYASVRLTECPLLDAALQNPDVVCGVHLGLARGALAAYGAPTDGTELRPFAELGACRLRLTGVRR